MAGEVDGSLVAAEAHPRLFGGERVPELLSVPQLGAGGAPSALVSGGESGCKRSSKWRTLGSLVAAESVTSSLLAGEGSPAGVKALMRANNPLAGPDFSGLNRIVWLEAGITKFKLKYIFIFYFLNFPPKFAQVRGPRIFNFHCVLQ